jgi:hypothetical protein
MPGLNDLILIHRANNGDTDPFKNYPELKKYYEETHRQPTKDLPDMFSQRKTLFKNKEIGKAYIDNVLDTVFQFIPEGSVSNISRFRDTLLHTAEKESQFGSYKGTYDKKDLSKEKSVGHGGILQVTDGTFDDVFFNNPIPEVKQMMNQLKEITGIDLNKIKNSEQINTDRQNFLRTPFGGSFAAAAVYIDQLNKGGKESSAAKKYFNRDDNILPFDPATMRNYFYFKGDKYKDGPSYKWSELEKDLKESKDSIILGNEMIKKKEKEAAVPNPRPEAKRKQKKSGGMVERNYHNYTPRNI